VWTLKKLVFGKEMGVVGEIKATEELAKWETHPLKGVQYCEMKSLMHHEGVGGGGGGGWYVGKGIFAKIKF